MNPTVYKVIDDWEVNYFTFFPKGTILFGFESDGKLDLGLASRFDDTRIVIPGEKARDHLVQLSSSFGTLLDDGGHFRMIQEPKNDFVFYGFFDDGVKLLWPFEDITLKVPTNVFLKLFEEV